MAVAQTGEVYVVWNGSARVTAGGASQFLFSRQAPGGKNFSPEQNLLPPGQKIDGGGAVAVGDHDTVYLFWHSVKGKERNQRPGLHG